MEKNETYNAIKERRKKIYTLNILVDLLLLIPPVIIEGGLLLLSMNSFLLSLFLTYFVLPMFYTVERRISSRISGIGPSNFSYADGYKAFFQQRAGGIFGIILSGIGSLALALLFYVILSSFFPSLCSAFDGAREVYDTLYNALTSAGRMDSQEFTMYLQENAHLLSQPLTILIGCVFFMPSFYFFFYRIDSNLCDHYLATIVLPDIDLNISASESRGLSHISFRSSLHNKRVNYALRQNWPYYLGYTILYALNLFLFSNIKASNSISMCFLMMATPSLSILYGVILNYFCLANEYATLEVIANDLLTSLPEAMKNSIYQTYINTNYIHGIESEIRGCFIPNPQQTEDTSNFQEYGSTSNPTSADEEPKPEEKKENIQFGMFDFSKKDDSDNKEDK